MKENLKEFIKNCSNNPGIYKMLDSQGRILYIGKSKNLRTRIQSYFRTSIESERIQRMVHSVSEIQIVETDTHLEAKILELREIKAHKPIYNKQYNRRVRLTYLDIDKNILTYKYDGKYGPFRKSRLIYELVDSLKNIYPMKIINDKIEFHYNLFTVKLLGEDLKTTQEAMEKILSERNYMDLFLFELERKMKESSKDLYFERAIYYRDLHKIMSYIYSRLFDFNNLYRKKLVYKEEGPSGNFIYLISQGQILNKYRYKKDVSYQDFQESLEPISSISPIPIDENNYEEINLLYSHIRNSNEGEIIREYIG